MKILYVYKDYYPVLGGMENYTRWVAQAMQRRGHEVEVLVTSTDRHTHYENIDGVPVLKTARWLNLSSAPISPRLAVELWQRQFSKHRPDIIHLQFPYPPGELTWLLSSFKLGARPRTVITYQSDIVRQKQLLKFYSPFLKQVLKRADLILPSSLNYLESSPFLRPVAAKCRVVPLGIAPERFIAPTEPPALLEDFWRNGFLTLLFVGKLRQYKGLQFLIAAVPQMNERVKLVIAGSGAMGADLKQQVANAGLEKRVYFAGEVPDDQLPAYYAACDMFVLPSHQRSEAFGVVLLEAMAAGKPVISTELGTGTSFVNQHGQTGLVVPPADVAALGRAVNQLADSATLRLQMGSRAQERVQTEFTLSLMVDRLEEIYRELSPLSV